jgi:hypothetical protein
MNDVGKEDLKNILLMQNLKNVNNNSGIPINIITADKSLDEKSRIKLFEYKIVENMNTLKKLSLKFNTKINFGIVTDLKNWRINFYRKPEGNLIETQNDYLTSLNYPLSVSQVDIDDNTYGILLKVIYGILSVDQSNLNEIKI